MATDEVLDGRRAVLTGLDVVEAGEGGRLRRVVAFFDGG